VLFVWLARVLSPAPFAAAAVAQGVLVIAQAVGDFGLSQAAVTVLPRRLAANPGSSVRLIGGAARGFVVAAAAAFVLCLLVAVVVPGDAKLPVAFVAPGAGATVLIAGSDGLLRAVGEFRRPMALLAASRLGAFAAIPLAASTGSAAWACAGLSAGTVVGSVPGAMVILRRLGRGSVVDWSIARAAVPLGVSQLFVVGGGRLNTVLVSNLASVASAAAFESTWRLYQLGQYLAGAIATALAPFISQALHDGGSPSVVQFLRRWGLLLVGFGIVWGGGLLAFRGYVGDALFGNALGERVATAIVPLAIVTPLSFAAFLATVVLAVSDRDRHWILVANAAGAVVNLTLVLALASSGGARSAAIATGAGVGLTSILLLARYRTLLRSLGGKAHPLASRSSNE
jgi:O-antigen/teichoic acid export membrane protein